MLAATVDPTADSLRRRRAAARRLPPLLDGRRDPLDPLPRPEAPETFGLSARELWAEACRLQQDGSRWDGTAMLRTPGWAAWEVQRRLADPRSAA